MASNICEKRIQEFSMDAITANTKTRVKQGLRMRFYEGLEVKINGYSTER